MPKSLEELRRLLKELKEQTGKPGAGRAAGKVYSPPAVPGAAPSAASGPAGRPTPPPARREPPEPTRTPARSEPPAAATPRLFRDEEPIPRRPAADLAGAKTAAPPKLWKPGAALAAAAVVGAGFLLDSQAVLLVGFLILCAGVAWTAAPADRVELEEFRARVAALERRVAALSLPSAAGGTPPGLAEELEELRAMVKSLFHALEAESPEAKPKREEIFDKE